VQDAGDDVVSDTNDEKPACPIEAVKHKHAPKEGENPNDRDEPKFKWTLGDALSGG
jgi:hypothetical protein